MGRRRRAPIRRAATLVLAAALPLTGASVSGDAADTLSDCAAPDAAWEPPCTLGLDCSPDGFPAEPGEPDYCEYALPRDCAQIDEVDCGNMNNRVELDTCLWAKKTCARAEQLAAAAPGAAHEYVRDFDFARGRLSALPGDLVCQGLQSPDTDRWCSWVEAVYPEASFLETSVWWARLREPSDADPAPFRRVADGPHPDCRMRDGQLHGRIEVGEAGFDCPTDLPLPGPGKESLRLNDVTFADTNQDGYLDAVATLSWSGGGSGSTTGTLTLTRLEPDGPLLHVRDLGPGFDCAQARTATEERICADPRITVLDGRLTRLYGHARRPTKLEGDAERRTELRDAQRRFLTERNAVCESDDAGPCLELYRARIDELQLYAERYRCDLGDVGCD